MCLHKQTQDGRKERERKQILQTWTSRGKRGLLEEKQKCLRTFLCDYTVLDKSRHSCSHFVFWAVRSVNRSAFICPCRYVLRHFWATWLDSRKLRAVEGKENCQFVLIMLVYFPLKCNMPLCTEKKWTAISMAQVPAAYLDHINKRIQEKRGPLCGNLRLHACDLSWKSKLPPVSRERERERKACSLVTASVNEKQL